MVRVVVVEDDILMQDLVSGVLEQLTREPARHVATGREALRLAGADAAVDCFIVDVALPDMSGIEVVRQVRRLAAHAETPVIVLTRRADEATVSGAFQAGATDFLAKPFHPVELASRVETATKPRRGRRPRYARAGRPGPVAADAMPPEGYRSSSVLHNFVGTLNRGRGGRTTFVAVDHAGTEEDHAVSAIVAALPRVFGPALVIQAHVDPTCLVAALAARPEQMPAEIARSIAAELCAWHRGPQYPPVRVGRFITPTFTTGRRSFDVVRRAVESARSAGAAPPLRQPA